MIYYGKNCKARDLLIEHNGHLPIKEPMVQRSLTKARVCDYTKELAALLKDYNKSYDFYLPEFDYQNDQLIMDFRDSGKSFEKDYLSAQNFCG